MKIENELPIRKPTRLKEFDYSSSNAYFITICVEKRKNILSKIVGEGFPLPKLSSYGDIAEKWIKKIYDKYQELLRHSRKFVDTLENRKDVMDYFYGKVRFEITLKGESQITEQLGVGSGIKDFFNAIDCAIRQQFNKVFNCSALELDTSNCNGYEEWAMAQILDKYNGDLKQIEQSIRYRYNSRRGLTRRMDKFKLVKSLTNKKENEIIKQVRNLL